MANVGPLGIGSSGQYESHDISTWQLLDAVRRRAFGRVLLRLGVFCTSGGLLLADFSRPLFDWRTWLSPLEATLEGRIMLMAHGRVFLSARPNEALLRAGTRPGFCRGSIFGSCGAGAFRAWCQVPVAEVGRSAKSHAIDRSRHPG